MAMMEPLILFLFAGVRCQDVPIFCCLRVMDGSAYTAGMFVQCIDGGAEALGLCFMATASTIRCPEAQGTSSEIQCPGPKLKNVEQARRF